MDRGETANQKKSEKKKQRIEKKEKEKESCSFPYPPEGVSGRDRNDTPLQNGEVEEKEWTQPTNQPTNQPCPTQPIRFCRTVVSQVCPVPDMPYAVTIDEGKKERKKTGSERKKRTRP